MVKAQIVRPDEIKKAAGAFDVDIKAAIRARIQYLLGLIDQWEAYIAEQTDVAPESDMMACLDEIIRLRAYEGRLKRGITFKDAITDEMIQSAREYPIERIVEFDRTGKSYAWCHEDKRPSLTWFKKGNRARCFPCDKTFSAIDVCMDRDGLTFVEAVKYLSGGA